MPLIFRDFIELPHIEIIPFQHTEGGIAGAEVIHGYLDVSVLETTDDLVDGQRVVDVGGFRDLKGEEGRIYAVGVNQILNLLNEGLRLFKMDRRYI